MKSTGMTRRLDELGRIVIPVELRRTLDLDIRDPLEIFVEEDMILLRKYQRSCIFCDSADDLIHFKGKIVCRKCAQSLCAVK